MKVIVHIRHRIPQQSDTLAFTRTFGSVEAANRFINRAGYPLDPSPVGHSLYATVTEY